MTGTGVPRLGVAVRCDHEVRLSNRRIGERCNAVHGSVLLAKIRDRTKVEGARWAWINTCGILAGLAVVIAEVALGHVAGRRVELRRGVGAGPLAVAAAGALGVGGGGRAA